MGPFEKHLCDAIKINKSRLPLYAALTNNESIKISKQLIFWEIAALPMAKIIDWSVRKYQAAGIPIAEEDIVSMDLTPDFKNYVSLGFESIPQFIFFDGRNIAQRIYKAYKAFGFSGILQITQKELDKIVSAQIYHCMLRHLLESMWRIAYLAPKHEELALARGMSSTRNISWFMIWLHLIFLHTATKLDKCAAPIQAKGIPIIAQDVPVIQESKFYT